MSKEVKLKVKEEILKAKFIRPTRYVEWLFKLVLIINKNRKLIVCIDFRHLNYATPKEMYVMVYCKHVN